MQIHMAAWMQNGALSIRGEGISHNGVLKNVDYPYILESFHYMTRDMVDAAEARKVKFFLDSGAFSMFTQGVQVDLKRYAKFVQYYGHLLTVASNLDAIGEGQEQVSYDRQKELESLGAMVKPVHHVRDADHWLERYLAEGYDYIFLGGMVPESTPVLMNWLDHVWHRYLTNPDGTPRVKVHGFGLTSLPLMFRYPWYSVDSTSWLMTASFGSVFLDIEREGKVKDYKIDFSTTSSKRYDLDSWHFGSLPDEHKRTVVERLRQVEAERPNKEPDREAALKTFMGCEQGFNPDALACSYGWRRWANVEYFRRAMNRRVDKFTHQQPTLWD